MDDLGELRARLRDLEDREGIRRTIQEYRRTLDARELGAFAALFAPDGTWSGRSGRATGPEAIERMLRGSLEDNPPAPGPTLYHLNTDPAIEIDGSRATAFAFWLHVRRGADGRPLLPTLGSYDDVLVRDEHRWRFFERRVTVLMVTP